MANKLIHTKHLGDIRYRDLSVYYEKGGVNHWTYRSKPKGIYFSAATYTQTSERGFVRRSYVVGQKGTGDGYIMATCLERYKPTALKAVQQCVDNHADLIHKLIEADDTCTLVALIKGAYSEEAIRGLVHAYAAVVKRAV